MFKKWQTEVKQSDKVNTTLYTYTYIYIVYPVTSWLIPSSNLAGKQLKQTEGIDNLRKFHLIYRKFTNEISLLAMQLLASLIPPSSLSISLPAVSNRFTI